MHAQHDTVVTRMPPSPTGHLHIGTARTALYNFLFARAHGGRFIMRSEDTDRARSSRESEQEILDGLTWRGLTWDAFYRQSERTDIYTGYLTRLVDEEKAYVSQEESKQEPGKTVEVIRLRNPNKEIVFDDVVRGEITFDTTELGDFVIARAMDDPLYHLVVVVDDHEMEVTHVIRGEDHISNTPRQVLIQEAIGAARPTYAHMPLILAPDRSKLSKRHGAVMLDEYKNMGFIPAGINNYLALLGWSPGTDQELFTLEELAGEFSLDGVQHSGAVFDLEKMRWFNRAHILNYDNETFFNFVKKWLPETIFTLPQYSDTRLHKLVPVIRERIHTGRDITEYAQQGEYDFAFATPEYDPALLRWRKDSSVRDSLPRLQKVAEIISTISEETTPEEVEERMYPYAEEVGKGEVLWPLRVALTGRERSPDAFTVIHIIGTAEAYKRVQHACDTIMQ